jgi:hypothetical protein
VWLTDIAPQKKGSNAYRTAEMELPEKATLNQKHNMTMHLKGNT